MQTKSAHSWIRLAYILSRLVAFDLLSLFSSDVHGLLYQVVKNSFQYVVLRMDVGPLMLIVRSSTLSSVEFIKPGIFLQQLGKYNQDE